MKYQKPKLKERFRLIEIAASAGSLGKKFSGFFCDKCKKEFTSYGDLKSHKAKIHAY